MVTISYMDRKGAGISKTTSDPDKAWRWLKNAKAEATAINENGETIGGGYWDSERKCWGWWIDIDAVRTLPTPRRAQER